MKFKVLKNDKEGGGGGGRRRKRNRREHPNIQEPQNIKNYYLQGKI